MNDRTTASELELDDLQRQQRRFRSWGRGLGMLPAALLLALASWAGEGASTSLALVLVAVAVPTFVAGAALARARLYPRLMPRVPVRWPAGVLLVAGTAIGLAAAVLVARSTVPGAGPGEVVPAILAASAVAAGVVGFLLGASWNTALFVPVLFGFLIVPVVWPARTEGTLGAFLGMAGALALLSVEEHRRARRVERRLEALDVGPSDPEPAPPASGADPLGDLASATRTYARYVSGKANGLRYLPIAALLLAAAGVGAASPAWGAVLLAPAPLVYLASMHLGRNLYARLGHVVEDPDHPEPSRGLQWAFGLVFLCFSMLMVFEARASLEALPAPARLAYLGLLAVAIASTPYLAWRWRTPGPIVGAAGGLAFIASSGASAVDLAGRFPKALAVTGLAFLALAVWEHRRYVRAVHHLLRTRRAT